jgi:hypothetical protein
MNKKRVDLTDLELNTAYHALLTQHETITKMMRKRRKNGLNVAKEDRIERDRCARLIMKIDRLLNRKESK